MLSEIVVKGQVPKTKLIGNSMITTIQGTVLGQSGTAKEMLAKVPGMTLKGEDLEVLGKGTHEAVATVCTSLSATPSMPRRASIREQVRVKPSSSA